MSVLRFVDAVTLEHFTAMSKIHAEGWRTTYTDAVPAEFIASVITDDHWIAHFQEDGRTGRCNGILLYNDDIPVSCATFGAARVGDAWQGGAICRFDAQGYAGWGEIISIYTAPPEKDKGYGGMLLKEVLCRLRAAGFSQCYVFVLRENEGARRFYAQHGFVWDGTQENIPFPPDSVCVDLRYVRRLDDHV